MLCRGRVPGKPWQKNPAKLHDEGSAGHADMDRNLLHRQIANLQYSTFLPDIAPLQAGLCLVQSCQGHRT